eukprot:TRINITY_DN6278_c1_g1_i1.p1 TRINITY_DN6278_c1_g1~~TRINITY_DN6278_c1_g1_i1.p1  ORF type:complete len:951 (+),score=200.85 TRINITY_DN6278_c1_g1_i1:63-2855(+)
MPPTAVNLLGDTVSEISAGAFHVCVVFTSTMPRCWGSGGFGELGVNTQIDYNTLVLMPAMWATAGTVAYFSLGLHMSCYATTDGKGDCWGINTAGQLGRGDTAQRNVPDDTSGINFGSSATVHTIVASQQGNFVCALLTDGDLKCWGLGTAFQLGNGLSSTIGDTLAEIPVSKSIVAPFISASLGTALAGAAGQLFLAGGGFGNNTANLTVLLDGSVSCVVTSANFVQLSCIPQSALFAGLHNVSVSLLGFGTSNTLVILFAPEIFSIFPLSAAPGVTLTVRGTGFGSAPSVRLGGVECLYTFVNDTLLYVTVPWSLARTYALFVTTATGYRTSLVDVIVLAEAGLLNRVHLRSGRRHSCLFFSGSALIYCWGWNDHGQLGLGSYESFGAGIWPKPLPPTTVPLGGVVSELAVGGDSACALMETFAVRCWGYGLTGQLGYGTTQDIGDETGEMPPGDVAVAGLALQIAVGADHTCVLLQSLDVQCWGSNAQGQLGIGSTILTPSPSAFANISLANGVQIAVGSEHTCLLNSVGMVRCLGSNQNGELGAGFSSPFNIGGAPGEGGVDFILPADRIGVSLACGARHTCVLANDGLIYCAGDGTSGQLGSGDQVSRNTPSPVSLLSISAMFLNKAFSCALLREGEAVCWGNNADGQLGQGDTNILTSPSASIPLSRAIHSLTSNAESHVCALLVDGDLECWGSNVYGQHWQPLNAGAVGDQPSEMPPPTSLSPPVIFAVQPSSALPGSTVTIMGTGFGYTSADLTVYVDSAPDICPLTYVSPLHLECLLACGFGSLNPAIVVERRGRPRSATFSAEFDLNSCPSLDYSPAGSPGALVTLTGQRFGTDVSTTVVALGSNYNCAVQQVTPTEIVCLLPNLPQVFMPTRVSINGTLSNVVSVEMITQALSISNVSPLPAIPNTLITISGGGFGSPI